MNFLNFADMFDGGGAGAVGDTFQGGPLSGLLNSIGIRPLGYRQRHGLLSNQPQMNSSRGHMGAMGGATGLLSGPPLGSQPGAPTAATIGQNASLPQASPVPEPMVAPTLPQGRIGTQPMMAETPAWNGQDVASPQMASPTGDPTDYRDGLVRWIAQNYPGFASMPQTAQLAIVKAYGMGIQ